MAEKKETLADKISRFATLIVAVTALVTAITSLTKAVDKRVEQAGYEALSTSIQALQKGQQALREQVSDGGGLESSSVVATSVPMYDIGHAASSPEMSVVDAEAPMAFIGPPVFHVSPTASASQVPQLLAAFEPSEGDGASRFLAGGSGGSVTRPSMLPAPAAAPRMMTMKRQPPTLVAPPKWDTVRERANSL